MLAVKNQKSTIPYSKPTISKKDLIGVLECMLTDQISEGSLTKKLEKQLARYLKTKKVLLVNHASSALYLICKTIGLKKGDEVLLSALGESFILEILCLFEVTPILVDVDSHSLEMSRDDLLSKQTEKTKAIIITHHLGYPFDLDQLPLKEKKMLPVIIEDCSNALGCGLKGQKLGLKGDFSFFSFSPKRMITMAQGGALFAKRSDHFKALSTFKANKSLRARLNFSTTDIHAAIGLSELSLIERFIKRRQEITGFYLKALRKSAHQAFSLNQQAEYHFGFFPIKVEGSQKIMIDFFQSYRIGLKAIFETPLFEYESHFQSSLPQASFLQRKTLCLPLYPTLTNEQVEIIGELLLNVY